MYLSINYTKPNTYEEISEEYQGVNEFNISSSEAYGGSNLIDVFIRQVGEVDAEIKKSFHVVSINRLSYTKE
ncbi:MAG: hypothetical protein LUD72_06415 [Bacteroidales bacterium]|nr:hypothetical protein [Bacteroidales bacterium]